MDQFLLMLEVVRAAFAPTDELQPLSVLHNWNWQSNLAPSAGNVSTP